MEINYCLFTLLHDNEARLSSIVAYLRKRNVVISHCYNSANVIEPRETHTYNNIIIVFICVLVNGADSSSEYIASDDTMVNELVRTWQEVVVP
jgi:hypothetical protein